jgi:hypothetical protein
VSGGVQEHLFEYVVSTDTLRHVVGHISGVPVVGISADGTELYAQPRARLAGAMPNASGSEPPEEGNQIYHLSRGSGESEWDMTYVAPPGGDFAMSPAGRYAVLQSTEPLTGFDSGGVDELYRYDALENEMTCLTCRSGAPNAPSTLGGGMGFVGRNRFANLTPDGAVVFSSSEKLVPQDVSAGRDIYQWRDGVVSLITSGRSARDTFYYGMSADGRDIVFSTTDALAPQDLGGNDQDMYVARANGGFLAAEGSASGCEGDECQGQPTPAPAGSSQGSGGGNAGDPDEGVARVRVARLRTAVGLTATLRVTVPGKGRLSVSGARLKALRKATARGGTYRIKVRLSAAGRRALARRGRLATRARVVFRTEDGRTATTRLRLAFKVATSRRSAR